MDLLPELDKDFLDEKEFKYELVPYEAGVFLIIHEFDFPKYTPSQASLLIKIPSGYPNVQLDMFWTSPNVLLPSGGYPTTSDIHESLNGTNWQRWSRHGEWRPGQDNLRNYITSIKQELEKGI